MPDDAFRELCQKLGWSLPPTPPPKTPARRWTTSDDRRFNAEYRVWIAAVGLKDEHGA